jgi:hypothetical protein
MVLLSIGHIYALPYCSKFDEYHISHTLIFHHTAKVHHKKYEITCFLTVPNKP